MAVQGGGRTARRATPARSLPRVVQRFIATEAASGLVLLLATTVALVWANSPWEDGYERLWENAIVLRVGSFSYDADLRHVVNDGLMALFFFVVGLEIKRELVRGELADRRVAALPVFAAIGGMAVPVALFVALTAGGSVGQGWGIPMATDIAFALGVLALLSRRLPGSLKLLLLTLAIVDDIGAILVIALFYAGTINLRWLDVALLLLVVATALLRLPIDWPPLYAILGVATWYATYRSGVHATIAGVAFGLIMPARALAPAETVRRWALDLSGEPDAAEMRQLTVIARETVSPAEHLEDQFHPFTSFVVLPCFALANAGVPLGRDVLSASMSQHIAIAVALSLVVGKFAGILGGCWLALRLRVASMPDGVGWPHLAGVAALGGIGFTVSLFIAGLAFPTDASTVDAAKVSIVAASTFAALAGALILRLASPSPRTSRENLD